MDPEVATARDELIALQQESVRDSETTKSSILPQFRSCIPHTFARVICDEGHKVKTIASRAHQSIALLERQAIWFITATPMWNRPLDFSGYLSLFEANLAKPSDLANSTDPDPSSTSSTFDDYTHWSAKNPLPTTGLPYHLLSVVQFASLGRGGGGGGHLTAEVGFNALPVILRMTTLAREPGFTMAYNNLESITIGADIPILATTTVELRYSPRAQLDHDRMYHVLSRDLHGPPGKAESGAAGVGADKVPKMNWACFRQLCHLAFNPLLETFLRRSVSVFSSDISSFADRGEDFGFGLFFNRTNSASHFTHPPAASRSPVILSGTHRGCASSSTCSSHMEPSETAGTHRGSWSLLIGP